MSRIETSRRVGEVIPLTLAYQAMASDIITEYCFGTSTNNLDKEDYNKEFYMANHSLFEIAHLLLHIGWLGPLMNSLPIPLVLKMLPAMGDLFRMQEVSGTYTKPLSTLTESQTRAGLSRSKTSESQRIGEATEILSFMASLTAAYLRRRKLPSDWNRRHKLLCLQAKTPWVNLFPSQ